MHSKKKPATNKKTAFKINLQAALKQYQIFVSR